LGFAVWADFSGGHLSGVFNTRGAHPSIKEVDILAFINGSGLQLILQLLAKRHLWFFAGVADRALALQGKAKFEARITDLAVAA